MINSKICKNCGIDKLFTEYTAQTAGKHGYTSKCKQCLCILNAHRYKPYYAKKKRETVDKGLCLDCQEPRITKFYCRPCADKRAAAKAKHWFANHDRNKQMNRNRNAGYRQQILDAYGHICACCGEAEEEFLQIDHINNKGYEHRKNLNMRYIYYWLIKNNFPKDNFQVLCANCNWGKRRLGYCPHQREVLSAGGS